MALADPDAEVGRRADERGAEGPFAEALQCALCGQVSRPEQWLRLECPACGSPAYDAARTVRVNTSTATRCIEGAQCT